ncbi:MAG: hypothetical protein ABI192_06735 [Bradyrhizobium sp.]
MSIEPPPRTTRYLKAACAFICFLILASNVWAISRWNESRGVYDDICYLRQAHLFQKFGLDGLDTNIIRDDDHYLSSKLKEIGYPAWNDPAAAPCHSLMPATQKRVMQYPPGTGFVLAMFPAGFQVIPLYVLASVCIFGFALLAIWYARARSAILLTTALGLLAIYLMINPTKASYSMAPTMVLCAAAGFLTPKLFLGNAARDRILLSALIGLLIGLAVNFRLPNLFLASGYCLFFAGSFLWSRRGERGAIVLQAVVFGAACLVGMTPTLLANAINAGSPFVTTYSSVDATPPEFSLSVIRQYLGDMQFVLLVLACGWTALILRLRRETGIRRTALVTAGNLAVNLAFFVSHPLFTPYYTVPVAMLSLWSLLFGSLLQPAVAVDDRVLEQAATARS